MNVEAFYEQLKEVLTFLDVPWGRKEEVSLWIEGGSIRFQHSEGKAALVWLGVTSKELE